MSHFKVQVKALVDISISVEDESKLQEAIDSLYFNSDQDGVEINEQMDQSRNFLVRDEHGTLCSPNN